MAEEDGLPLPVFDDSSDEDDDDLPPPMPKINDFNDDVPEEEEKTGEENFEEEEIDPFEPPLVVIPMIAPGLDVDWKFNVIAPVPEELDSDIEIGYDENCRLNGWKLEKKLGDGAYAEVFLASKDDVKAACKNMNKVVIDKETRTATRNKFLNGEESIIRWTGVDMMANELKVFNAVVGSEHCVQLLEVVEDIRIPNMCLFLELATFGDVMDWDHEDMRFVVGKKLPEHEKVDGHFTEDAARNYFRCLVLALQELHSKDIAHLDIKPQNLLCDTPGHAKLTDFGTCLFYDKEDCLIRGNNMGTRHFFSPACCKGKKRSPYQDDIWAAGVTLYAFLTGRVPFWADNDVELFHVIRKAEVSFPAEVDISDGAKDLLLKILTKKADNRLSLEGILEHPWMTI